MVRYATLVGYRENVLSGINSQNQQAVLTALFEADVPLTRRMIEIQTGLRISSVCPAVLKLLEAGLIQVAYQALDPHSDRPADYLEPVWPQPPQQTFDGFAPLPRMSR